MEHVPDRVEDVVPAEQRRAVGVQEVVLVLHPGLDPVAHLGRRREDPLEQLPRRRDPRRAVDGVGGADEPRVARLPRDDLRRRGVGLQHLVGVGVLVVVARAGDDVGARVEHLRAAVHVQALLGVVVRGADRDELHAGGAVDVRQLEPDPGDVARLPVVEDLRDRLCQGTSSRFASRVCHGIMRSTQAWMRSMATSRLSVSCRNSSWLAQPGPSAKRWTSPSSSSESTRYHFDEAARVARAERAEQVVQHRHRIRAGLRLVAQRLHLLAQPEEVEAGVEDAGQLAHRRPRQLTEAAHLVRLGAPHELGERVEPRDHLGRRAGDVVRGAAVDGGLLGAGRAGRLGLRRGLGGGGRAPGGALLPGARIVTPCDAASSRARSVRIAPAGTCSAAPAAAARCTSSRVTTRPLVTTAGRRRRGGCARRRARAAGLALGERLRDQVDDARGEVVGHPQISCIWTPIDPTCRISRPQSFSTSSPSVTFANTLTWPNGSVSP